MIAGATDAPRTSALGIIHAMRIAFVLTAALMAGCTTPPVPRESTSPPAWNDTLPIVVEAWRSPAQPEDALDSLATWPSPDGATWLIATAKRAHQLRVFDADTGAPLRSVGTQGPLPGQFARPNGIAVIGDLVFVVERDNRRVQVLELPGFRSIAAFGMPELRSPYGLWVHEIAPDAYEVHVTDNFMDGADFSVVPDIALLDQRVRRYRFEHVADGTPHVTPLGTYGSTDPQTALRIVESIAGDPAHDRVLVADEDLRHRPTLHAYTLEGRYTGRSLPPGTFGAEPEGIALWSCGIDAGYWVAVDQLRPRTVFHLFARQDLAPSGRFTGARTAASDGIALHAAATARFPAGALFAVDDDVAVVAFDLRDVVAGLRLDPACVR